MSAIREVMTPDPITISPATSIIEAARAMREGDIGGDVIVAENGQLQAFVTDRDIVIRALAADMDVHTTPIREICSADLLTVKAEDDQRTAVALMRKSAVRRLPVVEDDGRLVGVVSIGDLAVERDLDSALADISEAPPNT